MDIKQRFDIPVITYEDIDIKTLRLIAEVFENIHWWVGYGFAFIKLKDIEGDILTKADHNIHSVRICISQ